MLWINTALAGSYAPLTLTQAMALAEQASPKLAAGEFKLQGMGHSVARAGALPDPALALGISNLPVSGDMAWRTREDSMTMRTIGVMQEFPNSAKRKLRTEIAAAERDVEQIKQISESLEVRKEAARAWLEVRHAKDRLAVLDRLLAASRLDAQLLPASMASGRVGAAESYAVRAAVELTLDRIEQQKSELLKAQLQLSRLIGEEAANRPLAAMPESSQLQHPPAQLLATVEAHPRLKIWKAREHVSGLGVALSAAGNKPDMAVELMLGLRPAKYGNMLGLQFKFGLPVFQGGRQDLDVAASDKNASRAQEEMEEARRAYITQIRADLIDWNTVTQRIERFQKALLPLAQERLQAAEAAYRGGRGSISTVLEASRAQAETELSWHDAQLERDLIWVNFETLLEKTP